MGWIIKCIKRAFRRKDPKSVILDELILSEFNLIQAKLHLEDLNTECKKQAVNVEKYVDRIARLKTDLNQIIDESKENS